MLQTEAELAQGEFLTMNIFKIIQSYKKCFVTCRVFYFKAKVGIVGTTYSIIPLQL